VTDSTFFLSQVIIKVNRTAQLKAGELTMDQGFLDALKGFSTEHLLIIAACYSIGKLTTYAIKAKKHSNAVRILVLRAEVERLKNELAAVKGNSIEKAD
jgi:aspartate 1-decarboxylase